MKRIIHKILCFLLSPLRWNYRRRNGVQSNDPRKEIPNHILLGLARDMIREGHTATISVKGYSMRPFLEHQRDRVVLDAPKDLQVGDAVLGEITPGHYVLHRIIAMSDTEVVLMGDGNIKGTETCSRENIAGVVTHYIRPRRTILASDTRLKHRIRLWRQLLPIRRYLLFVYRAVV